MIWGSEALEASVVVIQVLLRRRRQAWISHGRTTKKIVRLVTYNWVDLCFIAIATMML